MIPHDEGGRQSNTDPQSGGRGMHAIGMAFAQAAAAFIAQNSEEPPITFPVDSPFPYVVVPVTAREKEREQEIRLAAAVTVTGYTSNAEGSPAKHPLVPRWEREAVRALRRGGALKKACLKCPKYTFTMFYRHGAFYKFFVLETQGNIVRDVTETYGSVGVPDRHAEAA